MQMVQGQTEPVRGGVAAARREAGGHVSRARERDQARRILPLRQVSKAKEEEKRWKRDRYLEEK